MISKALSWRWALSVGVGLATTGRGPEAQAASDPFAEGVRATPWLKPEEEQKNFHLPPGFEIQLVAAEPEILKPMNLAFDAQGRLWVTVTQEYPYPAPTNRPAHDAIRILEDKDGDGRADKVTTFADGLNIPIGVYPYRDGCIAWSIPNLWFFRDTDGDGVADRREVLYGPFDHTRDTHGNQASFRRGFDGWLYATHGYNNDSRVKGADGDPVHLNSGNTYRMRLDGSRLEQFTHGQVNPFGLAFDEAGNLFSSDCHSEPLYQLLSGGYYPSFWKPHDGLGFAPRMMEKIRGSTAIDGVSIATDNLWPEEFRGNFFFGDVMASRVMRDRAVAVGSTLVSKAAPDFVRTDDPWFRPVDTCLGPDGALYIADFYNRIIGHYEVPLAHPGRDRTSGRIWRVVYRGPEGNLRIHPRRDLSTLTAEELVTELSHPNLNRRHLATDQLTDRVGAPAVPVVARALAAAAASPFLKIHGAWVLQRLGALDLPNLRTLASDPDRTVRVHAMRCLADAAKSDENARRLARAGLQDADALVQRCAAEALGRHPDYENIVPLLKFRPGVPETDTHLVYVTRKAIRDHLAAGDNFARVAATDLPDASQQILADVALGVPAPAAGSFLLAYVRQHPVPRAALVEMLRHSARHAPESDLDAIAGIVRERFGTDPDLQLSLFQSIHQGLEQRGTPLSSSLKSWGAELAETLLGTVVPSALPWSHSLLEGASKPDNPWFRQQRPSADGDKNSWFLCSLPPGGEALTGVMRSKPFTVPGKLMFWLAGHDGFPDKPAQKKNVVRLRLVGTGEILAERFPPRNDTAQKVAWDLAAHAGQQGFIEVSDGDTGAAYAWLAVGRFDPPVPPLPDLSPSLIAKRQQAAADLAGRLRLASLAPALQQLVGSPATDAEARAIAARSLVAVQPSRSLAALAPLLGDASIPMTVRDQVAGAFTEPNSSAARALILEALRSAAQRTQSKLAQALTSNPEGCEALLQSVAEGKVSPHVLLDRNVKDKLIAARPVDAAARIDQLTKGIAPTSEQAQKLLEQRRRAYQPALTSPVEGAQVFVKNCAACHSLNAQGGNVGPQLDGIGQRGLERLCEDVLDPNRNVDHAFRSSLLTLKDGDIISGLFRRDEGELIVLADSTGKEITVPRKQVAERRESETSLMPENFGDIITPEEFNHLMAFLLSKSASASR